MAAFNQQIYIQLVLQALLELIFETHGDIVYLSFAFAVLSVELLLLKLH